MYNQILFTNILRLLEELGITKTELAAKAGVSPSFLSDLTNGKANPSLKIMAAIADALETSLPALLESTDLDRATLDMLAGGRARLGIPDNLQRVTALLNAFQAYTVRQWDEENRKQIQPNIDAVTS